MHRISQTDREQFTSDGAIVLRQVIGQRWLDRLAVAIERDIDRPSRFYHGYKSDEAGRFHANLRLWETDPDCRDYCLNSALPGLAAQLLKSGKVNLFYDQLLVKEPGNISRTPWHHDLPYWPVKGDGLVSFWLALDPVTHDSGALEFIKGSHTWNKRFEVSSFTPDAYTLAENKAFEPLPDIESNRDAYEILSWEMEPGDLIALHGLVLHGAPGNSRNDVRRRGYTVRYAAADTVYDPHPASFPTLRNRTLSPGDPLDSDQYPVVYPK